MSVAAEIAKMLPHPRPATDAGQLLLFAIRRMAAGGLDDAHAAAALLTGFGKSYRRPLILTRALMAELARGATQPIVVAPCCCPRMTESEACLIAAIGDARADPRGAHIRLSILTGTRDCLGALTSAQAVSQALADLGRPLR